jgi:hypothetical protein
MGDFRKPNLIVEENDDIIDIAMGEMAFRMTLRLES